MGLRYEGLTTTRSAPTPWLAAVGPMAVRGGESVDQVSMRADQAVAYAMDQMAERDVVFGQPAFLPVSHHPVVEANCARLLPRWVRHRRGVGVRRFEYGLRQLSALGLTSHRERSAAA